MLNSQALRTGLRKLDHTIVIVPVDLINYTLSREKNVFLPACCLHQPAVCTELAGPKIAFALHYLCLFVCVSTLITCTSYAQ